MEITEDAIRRIRDAFANPEYTWRTLRGVSDETELTQAQVRGAIRKMGGDLIKSEIPSQAGDELFTLASRRAEVSPSEDDWSAVQSAMENPKYTWRTLKGIAAEKGLTEAKVAELIQANRDAILQSEIPSADGQALYTTRKHYLEQTGPVGKMLGFYQGKLV